MARPRSEDKRNAILSAATRIIASQGLGAATAAVAKEAGVSNGSLFTYFETKADLLNTLYVELKTEMTTAALDGLPDESDIHQQGLHMWMHWLGWATSHPDKRRALSHLDVSDDITPESRQTGQLAMAGMAMLLERSREIGVMRDAPLEFVVAIMSAIADATMDYMIREPTDADTHCKAGFDALWRIIA